MGVSLMSNNGHRTGHRTGHRIGRRTGRGVIAAAVTVGLACLAVAGPAGAVSATGAVMASSAGSARAGPRPLFGLFNPPAAHARWLTRELRPSAIQLYERFLQPIPVADMTAAHAAGAEPVLDLDPVLRIQLPGIDHPSAAAMISASARIIVSGRLDWYLQYYADTIKNLRFPVMVAIAHEMNGNWYPWAHRFTPPKLFVAMWRHIHQVFTSEGATNITWVWTINKIGGRGAGGWRTYGTRQEWPGSAYVDLVGIDAYFRTPGQWFADRFVPTIKFLHTFTHKPILVTETGIYPNRNDGQQLQSLFRGIRRYNLRGLIYFNLDMQQPWQLTHQGARLLARLLRLYGYRRR